MKKQPNGIRAVLGQQIVMAFRFIKIVLIEFFTFIKNIPMLFFAFFSSSFGVTFTALSVFYGVIFIYYDLHRTKPVEEETVSFTPYKVTSERFTETQDYFIELNGKTITMPSSAIVENEKLVQKPFNPKFFIMKDRQGQEYITDLEQIKLFHELDHVDLRLPENGEDITKVIKEDELDQLHSDKQLLAYFGYQQDLHQDRDIQSKLRALESKLVAEKYIEQHLRQYISEEEIMKIYERELEKLKDGDKVRLRLMQFSDQNSAKVVWNDLKSGKSFADLADTYSIHDSAVKGGDTGYVGYDDLPKNIAKRVWRTGDLDGPIKAGDSYYIVRIIHREPANMPSLEEVRPGIVEFLEDRAMTALKKDLQGEITIREASKKELAAQLKTYQTETTRIEELNEMIEAQESEIVEAPADPE